MNLESFRQRCINRLTSTYNIFANIDKVYNEELRNALVEIQNDDSIVDKEESFNYVRRLLEQDKSIKVNKVIDTLRSDIRIYAKEINRLATDKEIYEYYKLVSSIPSSKEYNRYLNMSLSEFEISAFHEYVMSDPRIENIIICYSELEKNNSNSDNNSKNNNNNNNNNNSNDSNNGNDNDNDNDALNDKQEELKNSCISVINALSRNKTVSENTIKELETLYIELLDKGLDDYSKDLYKKTINKYNIYIHKLNQNESVQSRNGRFTVIDGITEILGKGVSLIRGTKAYKTRCLKKIDKANEENNSEKRTKYVKLLTDQDIVCNLTRIRRENTIESLNYKLVRDNALSERRTKRLYKTAEKHANSLDRQLDRKIQNENEIFESRSRTATMLNQYLEVISYANDYNQKVIDFEKFLNQLRMKNFLDETLYNIYHAEAENIANYRDSMNGSVYFLDLNDIVDLTNYYQDSEKVEKNIPFIKRRHS